MDEQNIQGELAMLQLCLGLCLIGLSNDQSSNQYLFEVSIYKLDTDGNREVLSRPQLLTRNSQEALISVGQMVPVIFDHSIKDGKTVYSVREEQVGILLRLTPYNHREGEIKLKLEANLSEVSKNETLYNTIYRQQITTARVLPLNQKTTFKLAGPGVDTTSGSVQMDITPKLVVELSTPNSP